MSTNRPGWVGSCLSIARPATNPLYTCLMGKMTFFDPYENSSQMNRVDCLSSISERIARQWEGPTFLVFF